MDKLKLHSPDFTQENIARLAELFPHCVTEARDEAGGLKRAIDFDQLRQELSDHIVEGPRERYRLDWPGKREALALANAPIAKTLRPVKKESVEFEGTTNLFVEGDNLDALKLLQETYLNRVKAIYIDPPYNKDADVLYNDKYSESSKEYFSRSNQIDDVGNRLVANVESNGRFHSDWLTSIYARLKVAKNLLAPNGVIFISINDVEFSNLKCICDEIFGSGNRVGDIVWKNATDNNPTQIAMEHEYIICYAKDRSQLQSEWKGRISDAKEIMLDCYRGLCEQYGEKIDLITKAFRKFVKENAESLVPLTHYTLIDTGGPYTGSRKVHNPKPGGYVYDVTNPETGITHSMPANGYRYPEETMCKLIEAGKVIFPEKADQIIQIKEYLEDYREKLSSWIVLDGRTAANQMGKLFADRKIFKNPKPHDLIMWLLSFVTEPSDIILDFYAGSASTAHAIMQLNAEDGGSRHFIMVQFPEIIEEKNEAFKAGYKNIAEIGKERIRRAGDKIIGQLKARIEGELPGTPLHEEISKKLKALDIGFRVLKVDSSNMQDVYYAPDATEQKELIAQVENIKSDRTSEDLLFQVLIDWGVDLSLPITREVIEGKEVFFVDQNALAACFADRVDEALIQTIARRQPLRAVFRDASFADDSMKINVEQIFKLLAPSTEVKSI